jgi:hypothetical protein
VSPRYTQLLHPNGTNFDEDNYEKQSVGFYWPQPQFVRQGVRWKTSLTLFAGFKVWAKGGLCEYKVKPILFSRDNTLIRSTDLPEDLSFRAKPKDLSDLDVPDRLNLDEKSKHILNDLDDLVERSLSEGKEPAEIIGYLTEPLKSNNTDLSTKKALTVKANELRESELAKTVRGQRTQKRARIRSIRNSNFEEAETRTIAPADATITSDAILNATTMRQVLDELGMNADPFSEWTFEDTYVAADFAYPFLFRNADGKDAVKIWPTISVGIWIPTARKPKSLEPEHLFRVPIGNDEHLGVSVDGALNFDFKDTLTFNVGIGATFFDKKHFAKFPIKIHPKQRGFLPWKAKVERKLGDTVGAHAGVAAHNFIDGASAYFEYSLVSHRPDKLTMLNADIRKLHESDRDTLDAFRNQMQETAWSSQELHFGICYQVTQNFEAGASFKVHVKGENVPKTRSIMASMRIAF